MVWITGYPVVADVQAIATVSVAASGGVLACINIAVKKCVLSDSFKDALLIFF